MQDETKKMVDGQVEEVDCNRAFDVLAVKYAALKDQFDLLTERRIEILHDVEKYRNEVQNLKSLLAGKMEVEHLLESRLGGLITSIIEIAREVGFLGNDVQEAVQFFKDIVYEDDGGRFQLRMNLPVVIWNSVERELAKRDSGEDFDIRFDLEGCTVTGIKNVGDKTILKVFPEKVFLNEVFRKEEIDDL